MTNSNHDTLFFAFNEPEALAEKGYQSLALSEEEGELLIQHFIEDSKITQIARLHSRT